MLYAHGPDLCHETDLRHAMANAFEAVMGAIFLDAGLQVVRLLSTTALYRTSALLWTLLTPQEDSGGPDIRQGLV